MPAIVLNLSTDIAKVRAAVASPTKGGCCYTAPCAVGAMMTEDQRQHIAECDYDERGIGILLIEGVVEVRQDQKNDLFALQAAYDSLNPVLFEAQLKKLEDKYAG